MAAPLKGLDEATILQWMIHEGIAAQLDERLLLDAERQSEDELIHGQHLVPIQRLAVLMNAFQVSVESGGDPVLFANRVGATMNDFAIRVPEWIFREILIWMHRLRVVFLPVLQQRFQHVVSVLLRHDRESVSLEKLVFRNAIRKEASPST
jgi:hypothetical protein